MYLGRIARTAYSQMGIRNEARFLGSKANPVKAAILEAVRAEARRIKAAARRILADHNLPPEVLDQLDRAIEGARLAG